MKRTQAEAIFNEFYNKTFKEAYGYILAKTGNHVATPIILKECYCKVLRSLLAQKKDESQDIRNFFIQMIHSQLIEYNKKALSSPRPKALRSKKFLQLLPQELEIDLPEPESKDQLYEMLDKALSLLNQKPSLQRRAFILYHLYDLGLEQVASELSITQICAGNYIYNLTKEIRIMFQTDSDHENKEEQI